LGVEQLLEGHVRTLMGDGVGGRAGGAVYRNQMEDRCGYSGAHGTSALIDGV
jgi:hypothetical protein